MKLINFMCKTFCIIKYIFKGILLILTGKLKAEKVTINIPQYLYHVVETKDVKNIEKDLCIHIQHYPSDWSAKLDYNSNTYFFYCFGNLPTKLQYEKSKGSVKVPLSVIKVKYNKNTMGDIYIRKFDNALILLVNSNEFKLTSGCFDIIPLNWN